MYTNPFIYKRPLQPGQDDLITIARPILLSKAIAGLQFGHWYLVCGGKKIGKTSLLLSLMHECRQRKLGYRFAFVKAEELQQYHLDELFVMICQRVAEQIPERVFALKPVPALYDFKEALMTVAQALPAEEKFVVVLDSLETLPKYLLQEFFRGLLHLHQLQATNTLLAKFQFILSGTLNTNDLQFEHGHSLSEYAMRLVPEDFRLEDLGIMMRRVTQQLGVVYEEGFSHLLYEYTNGAGYLVQKICYRLLERAFLRHETPAFSLQQAEAALDSIVKEGETNVEMVMTQIEKDSHLVETLMNVLRAGSTGSSKFDPNLKALVALGALSEQNGFYRVRNRIYESVFKDYFTTERLADLYFAQHKYERARDLISQAALEQVDAKNVLHALLGNIQNLGTSLEHGNTMRNILEAFMNVVDSTKNCSLIMQHPATETLHIVDAVGLNFDEVQSFKLLLGQGVAGWVARTGRYRIVRDVTDEIECPDFVNRELANKHNLGAMACFPLKASGRVLGVLSLCLMKPRSLTGREMKMLEALAAYASLALQNTGLQDQLNGYFDQLGQVRAAVHEAIQHTEVESIASKLLALVHEIMGTDKSYLVYRRPNAGGWHFHFVEKPEAANLPEIDLGEGLAGYAIKNGRDCFCDQVRNDERYFPMWKSVQWEWAIPCIFDNAPQGCLVVAGDKPIQLTPAHQQFLGMLADAISITLRNKRLFGIADKKTQQVITAHLIGEALSSENSLQEILNLVAAECLNSVERENKVAFVWIKDRERDKLILKAAEGEAFGREKIGRSRDLKQGSVVVSALNKRAYRLEPDVKQCAEYSATHADIKSEIAVPLIFRGEALGVIDVQSFKLDDFDEQEVEALVAVAHHAAVAIKVVEWCDFELKALNSLYDLGNKISSNLDLKKVLRFVCDEGLKLVGDEKRNFMVQLLDPATQAPGPRMMRGVNANLNKARSASASLSTRERWVIKNKCHYLSAEAGLDALHAPTSPQIKSALFVPILYDDHALGVITMESLASDDFGEKELRLLRGLASQAGVALANAHLGEKLAKTQMDLAKALESAAIEEIVAGLTHDIKNCSSMIAGETQWLTKLEHDHQLRFEDVRHAITNIEAYIENIEVITGNFKNRAYRLTPQLAPCRLHELVEEAIQMVAVRAARQEIDIRKDDTNLDLPLSADRGRLVRAFFNLMANALDAMPEGGVLKITAQNEARQIRLLLADSGPGIPEELRNKVLQAGFSTKTRGYGIGLALAKRIVETDHHGKLNLHSEVGKGTTIEMLLPQNLEPAQSEEDHGGPAPAGVKIPRARIAPIRAGNILVVNDDVAMLKKVARLLRSAGHRVAEVESGKEAVARCHEAEFDVIVLDYHLRKDELGSQTARDFVPDFKSRLPYTPIILTSASLGQLGAPEVFCDFFLEIDPSFWRKILGFVNQSLALKFSMREKKMRMHHASISVP